MVSRPESAPRTTALPEQAVQPRGVTRRQWRSVAKTALGVGLGALALTGFGGSRALKVHTALGLAFVALSLWHVSLYKPHKKNCA
ncbi:hypothetical protein [Fundidesulfovibrio magnetotacticus]|uniref:hypothetical protein n=1 Tax=Fundidesulfovibrio magnetotacticus TaxID=2730080 RepID=UPI00156618A8|nr:hypothetical protein [Fundidesulfovibrio magnetotacticus]